MVLGGKSTELVPINGDTRVWRPRNDDGSRVEHRFDTTLGNGDDNGEHWKITTPDGTQYYLGLNKIPGKPASQSVWTVPVYGNHANEPCNKPTFDISWCYQAWRWNLDYVVDPHGNVTTYHYERETNLYGRNLKAADATVYTRGGWLARIEYGLRTDNPSAEPASRVVFDVTERCIPNATMNCDPAKLNAGTAASWPDVPFDQICAAAPCDNRLAPTFFSRKRLTKITTQIWTGTETRTVDSWTLKQSFLPSGDGMAPSLWLSSIVHTGLNGGSLALPETKFDGTSKANRVDVKDTTYEDNIPPLTRYRLIAVTSDTGGLTFVQYSEEDCRRKDRMPANPETNTMRCFPQWWTKPGDLKPIFDWFHKYVVTAVAEHDYTGSAPNMGTAYQYLDGGAWHFDDNDLSPPDRRTWSQWRGYGKVKTIKGDAGKPQTVTETRYLRGMDGDRFPGGVRDVWVPDSENNTVEDHDLLRGFVRESLSYNGSTLTTATANDPWISGATAVTGDKRAHLTGTAAVRGRALGDGGAWKRSRTNTSFGDQGIPTQSEDLGDTTITGDEKCTRTAYARNENAWILTAPKSVQTVAGTCATAATAATILTEQRSSYDGKAWGAAPDQGNITRAEVLDRWDGSTPVFVTTARGTFDAYGRAREAFDAHDNKTTTSYTPATGGQVAQVVTTNPLGHTKTVTLDPSRGAPQSTVDASGARADLEYDALGRLTKVWKPGHSKANKADPDMIFEYQQRTNAPSVVTTHTKRDGNGYSTAYALFDGFARPRQTQAPSTAVAGGRVITDTLHDSRGLVYKTSGPFWNNEAPNTTLFGVADANVPRQTVTEFDGLERPTVERFLSEDVEKWRSTTIHTADKVSVTPPPGGTPTTVISNAQGQVIERRQHHGPGPSAGFDAVRYTYTRAGQLETLADAAGNTWRYGYDLRGRKTVTEDPDRGRTTHNYDNLDQLLSTTDARGKTIAHGYDTLGRKTGTFENSVAGPKLAEWTFDSLKKGLPTASTRYVGTDAYTSTVTGYDDANRPTGITISIPAAEQQLAGSHTFMTDYTYTGKVTTVRSPAMGGLPAESVHTFYDANGMPYSTHGSQGTGSYSWYASKTEYTPYGELNMRLHGAVDGDPRNMHYTQWYDVGSRRLSQVRAHRENTNGDYTSVAARVYAQDPAGNVTKIGDTPQDGPADTQCFGHDYLRRLTQAWTPGSGDCTPAPTVAGLGGAAPYWNSYTHDAIGNRRTDTQHTPAGDTTRTYTYPLAGQPRPHAVSSVATTGGSGNRTDQFDYDATGNTHHRNLAGQTQTLDYDVENRLDKITEHDGRTSRYLYDAGGARLIKREPGAVTLTLPGTELRLDTTTKAVTGTRFYSHAGAVVATRQGGQPHVWKIADHQGTPTLALNSTNLEISRRHHDPYGQPRGARALGWPDDKGFLGGTQDTTGLTHLGAREYDPTTGRFLTVDPLLDPSSPQQWNAYSYANNTPITQSDPTGLAPEGCFRDVPCYGYSIKHGCPGGCGTPENHDWGIGAGLGRPNYWHRHGGRVANPRAHPSAYRSAANVRPKKSYPAAVSREALSERNQAVRRNFLAQQLMLLANRRDTDPDYYQEYKAAFCGDYPSDVICGGKPQGPGLHGLLDVLGAIPGIGELVDIVHAGIYLAEGDTVNAGITALAAAGGDALKLARPVKATCSFSEDTHVLMADGTTKPIKDIKPGDQVLAADPETGEQGPRTVTHTWMHDDTLYMLDTSVGIVVSTEDHPYWNATDRRWQRADQLTPGDALRAPDGKPVRVKGVRAGTTRLGTAYNLTVDELRTYHVLVGDIPILVHNTCPRNAQWGVSDYRHGGQMSTIEHINYRHAHNSGFSNVSRFAEGTSVRDIKGYVDDALARGTVSADGGTIEYNIGRVIGTDQGGAPVTGIRVYVGDGIIKTAFPVGVR
ncbi:RHS repeat-associated core domain-containing protein [Herbihabitans rhizosphaerae]|nr:RHS repeat-associated core domain-containing protein [Herbihabitans rhizosphaerae]